MSTHSLYQYPPKSSIGVFTFFQNPGQGLVKKSPFCPGFQAIGPGLPGRKTAAPKGRPHGKPSVAFGPHPPRCVGRPLKEGRPACVRPPCAGTNGAKCALCPWGAGSRQLREGSGKHIPPRYRCRAALPSVRLSGCQALPGRAPGAPVTRSRWPRIAQGKRRALAAGPRKPFGAGMPSRGGGAAHFGDKQRPPPRERPISAEKRMLVIRLQRPAHKR